jgi:type I restriction enzyme S subunit
LSTCDRVIDLKKKLIEDKKKVKKWLMQTLLTGMIRVKDIENGTPYEELKKRIEQIRRGKVPQGYDRNGILGIIPEEWQVFQMSRIISTLTDFVANGSFASLRANVKYLRKQDYAVLLRLEDHSNDYKGEFVYVDMYSYQFLRKSVLKPGDIIIANVGARCGFVFRAPSLKLPMTLGPNAILLRTNQDDYWVYYFLSSSIGQSQLSQIKGTSAQPKFNKTDFRSLSICLPEIAEQIRIAEILSTADTEIDLLNKDLEQWELKKKSLMQLLLTGIVRVNAEN